MTNQMLSFKIYKQKHLMLINHSKTECLSICHLQQRTNRNRFYHGSDMCQIANIGFFFSAMGGLWWPGSAGISGNTCKEGANAGPFAWKGWSRKPQKSGLWWPWWLVLCLKWSKSILPRSERILWSGQGDVLPHRISQHQVSVQPWCKWHQVTRAFSKAKLKTFSKPWPRTSPWYPETYLTVSSTFHLWQQKQPPGQIIMHQQGLVGYPSILGPSDHLGPTQLALAADHSAHSWFHLWPQRWVSRRQRFQPEFPWTATFQPSGPRGLTTSPRWKRPPKVLLSSISWGRWSHGSSFAPWSHGNVHESALWSLWVFHWENKNNQDQLESSSQIGLKINEM